MKCLLDHAARGAAEAYAARMKLVPRKRIAEVEEVGRAAVETGG